MANLVQNPGFELLDGPNNFTDWLEIGTVLDETVIVHNGDHSAQLGISIIEPPIAAGAVSQVINGLVAGNSYTLSFWAASDEVAGVLLVTMTNIISATIGGNVVIDPLGGLGEFTLYTFEFTATDTTSLLTIANVGVTIVYLDDVSIVLAAICYAGDSIVRTKNIQTGEIKDIEAKDVYSGIHEVYSINKNQFVPVKLNVVSGPTKSFRCIKKDSLGENQPSHDFYVTSGHKIVINGVPTKVRDIPQAQRLKPKKKDIVYSICVEENEPILVNNLPVIAWGHDEWLKRCEKHVIIWKNNTAKN
ncbi:putative ORFan [Tupanvirus deep ocean]|uniref:ORFan n=2 Tax=Tupanvirus TaxID=2094720 RepID=A0AC62A9F8_9VIRU|nr:putative ORFan [Tupanvirus deep ocean]QKU34416.1 putative ORFan [Tupanvirus deep ocean]